MTEMFVAEQGGVVTASALLNSGLTHTQLSRLTRSGTLTRLRPGWYCYPTALTAVRRAVEAGGCLACLSALEHHGLWTPPSSRIHVRRSESLRNLPVRKGVRVCRPPGRYRPVTQAIDPVRLALLTASTCLPPDDIVVLMDSVLNQRLLTEGDLAGLFRGTSAARLLQKIDRSESGTETYVRLRLRSRGVKVRVQVQIGDIGRVDLLVGDRLVLECDSRSHHENPDSYADDRLRDRRLRTLGYHVVRLTYAEVMTPDLWAAAEADLLTMIRRGDHLLPRRRSRAKDLDAGS